MATRRYLGKHSKECYTRHPEWSHGPTPWCLPQHVWADKRGSLKQRTCSWILWRCNDPKCEAEFMVREDVVFEAIGEGWPD